MRDPKPVKPTVTPVVAAVPPVVAAPAAAPIKAEEVVRVYNRSTRQTFEHGKHKLPPSMFVNVPRDVADRWLRLFPDTVVEAAIAQKELGGAAAELALVRDELAAAKKRISELEEQLKVAQSV